MKRAATTDTRADPFPQSLSKPTSFSYVSDMALVRFKETIKTGIGKDALYIIERDYRIEYTLEHDFDVHEITVPAGMLTDLASVPVFARWFVGRVGRHLEAAIVHDYLYTAHKRETDDARRREKRKFADQMMLVGMRDAGVDMFRAWVMFIVIRAFGWMFSKGNHEDDFLDTSDPDVLARLHHSGETRLA